MFKLYSFLAKNFYRSHFCSYQYLESSEYNVCCYLCGKQSIKEQNGKWNPKFFFGGFDIEIYTINLLLSILFVYFPCRILTMSTKCPGPGPRKAIPHHIDSITKELKYVDPTHRNCVPGFKAASFTPKKKKDKYHGRTHNCIASMRMTSGDMYAVRIILHLSMWIVFSYHEASFYTYNTIGLPWILLSLIGNWGI